MSHRRKSARPTNRHWRNSECTEFESPSNVGCEEEEEDEEMRGRMVPVDSGQAIEIPQDIFQDFEQLKHATNLDTTTLMRNLLKDYHRAPPRSWHQPQTESANVKGASPVLDDKSVMRESIEDNLYKNPSPLERSLCGSSCDSPTVTESGDQPLDLSLIKSETPEPRPDVRLEAGRSLSEYLQQHILQKRMREGSPYTSSSSPIPAAVSGVLLQSPMVTSEVVLSRLAAGVDISGSLGSHVVMSTIQKPGVANSCEGQPSVSECSLMMPMQMSMQLPTVTAMDAGNHVANFKTESGLGSIVAIPVLQAVAGPSTTVPVHATPVTQTQPATPNPPVSYPPPTPAPQPHVAGRRGRKPGSLNKGNKVNKPAKSNEMKIIAENTMFPGVYTSILKLPWSRRSRTKAHPAAPPMSTMPVKSAVEAPTTALEQQATPTSVLTSSAPPTTQSVMMVYPNATISALGKPVRKRGRPPKLPVLSHLLAEKRMKKEEASTSVATPVPSQSASISADGSMLSILSSHSIGAEASTDDAMLKCLQTKLENPEPLETAPNQQVPDPATPQNEPQPNNSDGAMFQEMILSSKSLINIKPRKRQFSNVLKSGENFICTSFRIRPRGPRNKTAATASKQKSVSPPALPEPVPPADPVPDIESPPAAAESPADRVSPTSTVDDSPLSKNMFQELYHCKVCNEIVPAEEKQSHKQQHVPVKFYCLTCGQEYYSFLQTKEGEDPEAPRSYQCEQCSEGQSHSGLKLKTNSLQCDVCKDSFKTFSEYCEHRKEAHKGDKSCIDNFPCEECGKLFFTEKSLNAHKETHIKKTVKCVMDDCPVLSLDEEELDTHVKMCHDKKDYACVYDDCRKKFMKKFHLQEHIRVKHFNIRAFRCSWPGCYKEFAAERHLKVHLLIHKDEKPLKCDFCDYRCRQRNAMNWHMRKHPEAPYRYRKFGMLSGADD